LAFEIADADLSRMLLIKVDFDLKTSIKFVKVFEGIFVGYDLVVMAFLPRVRQDDSLQLKEIIFRDIFIELLQGS
jgi:hypothetical protein